MAVELGYVHSGSGKKIKVKWDQGGGSVYVTQNGISWKNIGKAANANEAMNKAEAWVYDK